MKKLVAEVENAVRVELQQAQAVYGGEFNSYHEAYAVILEEVEEAIDEYDMLNSRLEIAWDCIKQDNFDGADSALGDVRGLAIAAAAEMIQVAAMCSKTISRGM